jgi:hypothetical protein
MQQIAANHTLPVLYMRADTLARHVVLAVRRRASRDVRRVPC